MLVPTGLLVGKKKVLKGPEEEGDMKKVYEEQEDAKGLFLPH